MPRKLAGRETCFTPPIHRRDSSSMERIGRADIGHLHSQDFTVHIIEMARYSLLYTFLLRPNWAVFVVAFALNALLTETPRDRLIAAESATDELINQARVVFNQGERDQALALAKKAIESDPKNPHAYEVRGRMFDAMKQFDKAVADYDEVLKLNAKAKQIFQLRGAANFKLGRIQQSISDFDRFVQFDPAQAPHHWQRGISYYYAGRYNEGRRQFELHQSVNPNDVENAVWHYLCVARAENPKKARELLIPIQGDQRVPMMEIYALYRGTGSADAVLSAAKAGNPPPEELKQRLFYAHLYLGLYYEAQGDAALAKEHIIEASDKYMVEHYMGDVAKVHVKLRWQEWQTK